MDLNAIAQAIQKSLWTKDGLNNYKIGIKAIEKAVEKALQEIEKDNRSDELEKRNLEFDRKVIDKIAEKTAENISKRLKYGLNIDMLETEEYVSSPKLEIVCGVSHPLAHKLIPKFNIEENNKLLEDNNLLYNSIALSKKSKKNLYLRLTSEEDIKKLDVMDFSLLTLFGSLLEKNPNKKAYTLQEIARELIPLDENVKIRSDELYQEIIQSCSRLNMTQCYLNFEQDEKTKKAIEEKGGSITQVVGSLFSNEIVGIRLKNGEKIFGVNLLAQSKFYFYFKEAKAIRSCPKSLFEISSKNSITFDFITIYLLLRYRVINFISFISSGKSTKTDFEISVHEIYDQFIDDGEKLTNGKKQRIRQKAERILDEWVQNGLLIKWEALKKNRSIHQYKIYIEDKDGFKELKKYAKSYQEIENIAKTSGQF